MLHGLQGRQLKDELICKDDKAPLIVGHFFYPDDLFLVARRSFVPPRSAAFSGAPFTFCRKIINKTVPAKNAYSLYSKEVFMRQIAPYSCVTNVMVVR